MKIKHAMQPFLSHRPSDGGFMFASLLTTAMVFGIYAFNLYLVSLGNVQNSGVVALLFSSCCSIFAVVYQIPKTLHRRLFTYMNEVGAHPLHPPTPKY